MGLLLKVMLLSASHASEGLAKKIERLMVPSEVYWAAHEASGVKLCNRTFRQRQEREFDRRFGHRVSKLIEVIQAKQREHPEGDDLAVTLSCINFQNRNTATKTLARALDDFEPILHRMERKYGITNP